MGLNEEEMEAVTSGKYSLQDLVQGKGTRVSTPSPTGGPAVNIDSPDYKAPMLGFGMGADAGQKAQEFSNVFKQYQSLLGGKGADWKSQEQREVKAQKSYDDAKEAYADATSAAHEQATEVRKLNEDFKQLGATLKEESALRQQNSRNQEVKDADTVLKAIETRKK